LSRRLNTGPGRPSAMSAPSTFVTGTSPAAVEDRKISSATKRSNGATLLMSFTSHTINATLYPRLPFDPVADFTPLTMIARSPSVLVAHPALPVKDLRELLAYARARPGQLSFAIGGLGSSLHLAGEALKLKAGLYIVNIPYRGTAPAVTDLISGQLQLTFTGAPVLLPFIKSGQLRALAVSSSTRLETLPDVPTVAESGYKGFTGVQWYGIVGPANLPPAIVTRLNEEINRLLEGAELRQQLSAEALEPMPMSPEQFTQYIRDDIARWSKLAKERNIQIE